MRKHNLGFTIFEMLVVLTIITLIAVLVLVNYRQGQKQYAVAQAAQGLAADIREAQGRAITGASPGVGSGVYAGYGVYIQSATSYIMFYSDKDANNCPSGTQTPMKTVSFPGKVSIDNVGSRIFFVPPQPNTCLKDSSGAPINSITFTLSGETGQTKSVLVNKFGKIDVQ